MENVPENLNATDSVTNAVKKSTAKKVKIEVLSNFGERLSSLFEIQPIAEASPEIQTLILKVRQLVLLQQHSIDSLSRKWKQGDEKLARFEEKSKKELKDARDSCEMLERTINSYKESVYAKDAEIMQLQNQLLELQQLRQLWQQKTSELRKPPEQLESIHVHSPVAETNEISQENANLAEAKGFLDTDRQQNQFPKVDEEATAEVDRAAAEHFVRYELEATKGELLKCKADLKEVSRERDNLKVQVDQLLEAQKRSDKDVLDALDKTTGPQQPRGDELTGSDVTALFSLINLTHRFLGIACAQHTSGLPIAATTKQHAVLNSNSGGSYRAAVSDDFSEMTTESAVSYLSSRISAKSSLISSQIRSDTLQINHANKLGHTTEHCSGSSVSTTQIGQTERSIESQSERSTMTDLHEVEEPDRNQAPVTMEVSRIEGTSMMDSVMLKEALMKLNKKYNQTKGELRKLKEQFKTSTVESTSLMESLEVTYKERDDYASQIKSKSAECEELKMIMRNITDDLNRSRATAEENMQNAAQHIQSLQQQLHKTMEELQKLRQEVQINKNVKLELERVKSDLRQVSASTNMTSAQITGLSKPTREAMGLTQQSMHSSAELGGSYKSSGKKPSNY